MLGLERGNHFVLCVLCCCVLFSGKSRDCWIIHVLRSSRVMHCWVKKVFVGFNLLGNIEQEGLPHILLKGLSTLLYVQRYSSRFSFSRSTNLDNSQSCHAAIFTLCMSEVHINLTFLAHVIYWSLQQIILIIVVTAASHRWCSTISKVLLNSTQYFCCRPGKVHTFYIELALVFGIVFQRLKRIQAWNVKTEHKLPVELEKKRCSLWTQFRAMK